MKNVMKYYINKPIGWIANGIGILFLSLPTIVFADTYRVGDTFRDCATCPEMVVVQSGSFMMGSPADEPDRDDDEGPQHRVTISKPFAVGKYEVTRGQFAAFVDATGYDAGSSCLRWDGSDWHEDGNWRNPGFTQPDTHPVVCISWDDAKAYINWLSRETEQNYRLLSEAEWEYVARAGTTTAYHFGASISPTQANYDESNVGTVEVGSYPANAFGLHDVHGNVWEWVEDCWHSDYNGAPSDGSAWTSNCYYDDDDVRVLRGGAWDYVTWDLRSAGRYGFVARDRLDSFGFRIARTLTSQVGDAGSEEIEHPPISDDREETQIQEDDTFRDCATCPEMVEVPSGSFMMGSPADEPNRESNEGPQHRVTISKPFAVGKYEVTRGQFAAFVDATGYNADNCDWPSGGYNWRNLDFTQTDTHPVVCISWYAAKAYINWLSARSGKSYRLLTEAEWEYVARAGTTAAYHFGATISPSRANYWYDGREDPDDSGTVEVGSYPANAFGLHDVHGNVLEYVEDCWHDDYKGAPSDGSAWTGNCSDEDDRVLRGGGWEDSPGTLRSAYRIDVSEWFLAHLIGFRVARTLTP